MSRKILLLTDSLALPRVRPEVCRYNDTWPELLKKNGYIVHQVSVGGATSADLLRQVAYHIPFEPDYVIVQVGIVDCAPRFMTQFEIAFCRKLGVFGRYVIRLMNTNLIRRMRRITYITPKQFRNNVTKIVGQFGSVPVFFVGIIPPSAAYEKHLPGIIERVAQYNTILQNITGKFLSLENFDHIGIMSDYHHLNADGNWQIYQQLERCLND